jgi:hypothetical protein
MKGLGTVCLLFLAVVVVYEPPHPPPRWQSWSARVARERKLVKFTISTRNAMMSLVAALTMTIATVVFSSNIVNMKEPAPAGQTAQYLIPFKTSAFFDCSINHVLRLRSRCDSASLMSAEAAG